MTDGNGLHSKEVRTVIYLQPFCGLIDFANIWGNPERSKGRETT